MALNTTTCLVKTAAAERNVKFLKCYLILIKLQQACLVCDKLEAAVSSFQNKTQKGNNIASSIEYQKVSVITS